MAQDFLAADREQGFLLPPDVREWLPEGHFAWFVIEAVAEMDLGAFYAAYRRDGQGRAAFEPAMMVALLLYAYARGIRSSRAIERACEENVAFRVVAAHLVPDHTTIARFRQRHQDALTGLFAEVLALCADAGLVDAEVVAVDGTKVYANASERATCDYEQIARDVLAEADAVDAEQDERFGDRRGDELPAPLGTREGRAAWLADARRRLEQRRAEAARPIPASRPARLREAKRRLEEEHRVEVQANAEYEAYRARGVDKNGKKFPCAEAVHAAGHPAGQDQHHRPRLPERQDSARVGAGLQRPSGDHRASDRHRRRADELLGRLRADRTDRRRRLPRAPRSRRPRPAWGGAR